MPLTKAILGTPTKDNIFIIFPALAGFLFFALYILFVDVLELNDFAAGLILILIFSVFFDINHYFSTYLKVFLDKQFYQENKAWLLSSTAFIFIAAIVVYLLIAYESHDYEGYLYVFYLRRFVIILGLWHSVKQNWGFMSLYKRYENEPKGKIYWELIALASGAFAALTLFSIQYPLWFPATEHYLLTPDEQYQSYIIALWHKIIVYLLAIAAVLLLIAKQIKIYQIKNPANSVAQYCLLNAAFIYACLQYGAKPVLYVALITLLIIFIISLSMAVWQQSKMQSVNKRKWQLFAMSLMLYFGVLLYPMEGDSLIKVGAITLPHNIQYLLFVPYFMKKQIASSNKNHGIAKFLLNRTLAFVAVALLFSVLFETFRTGNLFYTPTDWALTKNLIAVFFIAMVFHHYYLDAVIWKFDKQKNLLDHI